MEIFNAYGDHQIADRQVLEGGEAEGVCESILPYTAATAHEFGPGELGLRRITVLRFEGETTRTVWVYGLPGPDTGTALVLDDGSSFLLPNRGPEPYWSAVAEAVGREELPRR